MAVDGSVARHAWRIDEAEYARHEERRGRRFAYGPCDATRIALVVIDIVPFFLDGNPFARGIVPVVERAAAALRKADGTVAWVHPSSGPPSDWQIDFFGEQIARRYASSGGRGSARSVPGLDPASGDLMIEKRLPSPFSAGSSTLDRELRAAGVERIWIAGTVTSVCCESTARDAAALGYEVVMVADATADVSDTAHNAALRTVYRSFGDVRAADDLIEELRAAPRLGRISQRPV